MNTRLRATMSISFLLFKELLPSPSPSGILSLLRMVYVGLYMYVCLIYMAVFNNMKLIDLVSSIAVRENFNMC